MTGTCRLLDAASGNVIEIGDMRCDWLFGQQSLDVLRKMGDRELVDTLLDFRRTYPHCHYALDKASEWMRGRLGLGFRVTVELDADSVFDRERRTVCLDNGFAQLLDNGL